MRDDPTHPSLSSFRTPEKRAGQAMAVRPFQFLHLFLRLDDAHAIENREHNGCGHDRPNLSAGVGAHGVHEEIVLLVIL